MDVNVTLNSSGSIILHLTISQLTFHSLILMLVCRNIVSRGRLGHYAKHCSNSTFLNVFVDCLGSCSIRELLFEISMRK